MAEKKTEKKAEEKLKINDIFDKLDTIVKEMEDPGLPLEESFEHYTEGLKLLKQCNESIEQIEKQIVLLEGEK
ncbi:MAG: exodeoxyribonuclease VII small subunit [Lachnospiraceae bacterium]|nr:exodeoxyribonuclease VII small subunit [Lachnospiraceae bacterium]